MWQIFFGCFYRYVIWVPKTFFHFHFSLEYCVKCGQTIDPSSMLFSDLITYPIHFGLHKTNDFRCFKNLDAASSLAWWRFSFFLSLFFPFKTNTALMANCNHVHWSSRVQIRYNERPNVSSCKSTCWSVHARTNWPCWRSRSGNCQWQRTFMEQFDRLVQVERRFTSEKEIVV